MSGSSVKSTVVARSLAESADGPAAFNALAWYRYAAPGETPESTNDVADVVATRMSAPPAERRHTSYDVASGVAAQVTVTCAGAVARAVTLFGAPGGAGVAEAASCDTGIVIPATTSAAVRAAPLFSATAYVTCPSPRPLAAPVSVIHEALVDADQLHVEAVVTSMLPVPPASGNETDEGLTP